MPKVLIKESSFTQLQNNLTYTIILSNDAFIFNQLPNSNHSEKVFRTKIEPSQIKKFQLLEKDKTLVIYLEFTTPDNQNYSFTLTSLDLPISNLYDNMMKIIESADEERIHSSEEIPTDENVDETKNEDPFTVAFNEFITKAQSTVTSQFIHGF